MDNQEHHTPSSGFNYSQLVLTKQKLKFKAKINDALQLLRDPFNSKEITSGLQRLETSQQRVAFIDKIIVLRQTRRREKEKKEIEQYEGIIRKAHKRFTQMINQETTYERDFTELRRSQENYLNELYFPKISRRVQLKRVTSLTCLTSEHDTPLTMKESYNNQKSESRVFPSTKIPRQNNVLVLQNYSKQRKQESLILSIEYNTSIRFLTQARESLPTSNHQCLLSEFQ